VCQPSAPQLSRTRFDPLSLSVLSQRPGGRDSVHGQAAGPVPELGIPQPVSRVSRNPVPQNEHNHPTPFVCSGLLPRTSDVSARQRRGCAYCPCTPFADVYSPEFSDAYPTPSPPPPLSPFAYPTPLIPHMMCQGGQDQGRRVGWGIPPSGTRVLAQWMASCR